MSMHGAVQQLNSGSGAQEQAEPAQEYTPAMTVRKSLSSPDHLISLVDGKPYKSLKRHLAKHGLTPVQYRERYGLKADYPMVAPTYAATRRELAKKIGLGRKPGQKSMRTEPVNEAAPAAPSAAAPAVATNAKAATKSNAAPKPKAAVKPKAGAKVKAAAAPKAAPAPATAGESTAKAKPAPRKKLGLQFGANGAGSEAQS